MMEDKKREISEIQALITLIQVYLSHTSKWYSSLIASAIGLIAIPIVSLNITITNNPTRFDFIERSLFSFMIIILLLVSLYLVSKVIYSLSLLQHIYEIIEIKGTDQNLSQYLIQMKSELLSKIKAFKIYKLQKDPKKELAVFSLTIPLLVFVGGGLFLFFTVWWGHEDMVYGLILFGSIYLLLVWNLFHKTPIL